MIRKLLASHHSIRFILHALTGGLATIVHYAIMFLLLTITNVSPLAASGTGFIGGAVTKFILSHKKVFQSQEALKSVVPKFLLAITLQAILNYLLLKFFLSWIAWVWVSQLLTTGCITFINYLIYYFWVFK